ncbi:MAG TPA: DUF3703 domain-containing protein [Acidimicrobiales bacterium]|nr:DUF3703 domain-containing protein [Acidimicrobiales bacterium]
MEHGSATRGQTSTQAPAARAEGDATTEWIHLERAHILSQPRAKAHLRTHLAMLGYGVRRHDHREVTGQLRRLVVAGPGSAGVYCHSSWTLTTR